MSTVPKSPDPIVVPAWTPDAADAAMLLVVVGATDRATVQDRNGYVSYKVVRLQSGTITWWGPIMAVPAYIKVTDFGPDSPFRAKVERLYLRIAGAEAANDCALLGSWCITHGASDSMAHHFDAHPGAFND